MDWAVGFVVGLTIGLDLTGSCGVVMCNPEKHRTHTDVWVQAWVVQADKYLLSFAT